MDVLSNYICVLRHTVVFYIVYLHFQSTRTAIFLYESSTWHHSKIQLGGSWGAAICVHSQLMRDIYANKLANTNLSKL